MDRRLRLELGSVDDVRARARRVVADPRARVTLGVAMVVLLGVRSWYVGNNWALQDLGAYRRGAWGLWHLRDPYSDLARGSLLPFIYPTFAAIVFLPLIAVPVVTMRVGVTAVSMALLFVCVRIALRHGLGVSEPNLLWASALGCLLVLPSEPVFATIGLGQVNLLLMTLVLVDVVVVGDRRWSGVLLGVAVGIKLTPAVFVVYLAVRGRWTTVRNSVLTAAATLVLSVLIAPGPTWSYFVEGDFLFSLSEVAKSANQSLNGALSYLLREGASSRAAWVVAVAVVAPTGFWAASRLASIHGEIVGLAVIAVVALLVAPSSWTHYWVWWFVVEVVLIDAARRGARGATAAALLWPVPFYWGAWWFPPYPERPEYDVAIVAALLDRMYVIAGVVAWMAAVLVAVRRTPVPARTVGP